MHGLHVNLLGMFTKQRLSVATSPARAMVSVCDEPSLRLGSFHTGGGSSSLGS